MPAEPADLTVAAARPPPATAHHAWRELAGVALLTAASAMLSAHYDLSEHLAQWLRRRETLQVDELPGVLLVLTCGLLWFGWRRYRDVLRALDAHRRAESRLAEQLERNRALHRELLAVQERERRSVARELHDELGQYLGALRFDLHALGPGAAQGAPADPAGAFARASQTLDHLQATLRGLIRRLRPVALDELGLAAALDQLIAGWRPRMPDTRFVLDCTALAVQPDEAVAIATFRIVQEALTNVARHSRAGLVTLTLGMAAEAGVSWLRISVEDDGVGADPSLPRSGLGLVSMSERAQALGGRLAWHSRPGDGFEVHASLPLQPPGTAGPAQ